MFLKIKTWVNWFIFSSLLAVAFDDYTIQIYDIDTKAVVRSFFGHRNVITDIVSLLSGNLSGLENGFFLSGLVTFCDIFFFCDLIITF